MSYVLGSLVGAPCCLAPSFAQKKHKKHTKHKKHKLDNTVPVKLSIAVAVAATPPVQKYLMYCPKLPYVNTTHSLAGRPCIRPEPPRHGKGKKNGNNQRKPKRKNNEKRKRRKAERREGMYATAVFVPRISRRLMMMATALKPSLIPPTLPPPSPSPPPSYIRSAH